jgi:hypothetical protein
MNTAPTVTFTTASQSGAENVGTFTITAELSEASGLDVTVPFTLSGTAVDPADYGITASPITITAETQRKPLPLLWWMMRLMKPTKP